MAQGQIRRFMASCSHVLLEMIIDADPEKSQRVMKAMLQMKKIDIEELKQAYAG